MVPSDQQIAAVFIRDNNGEWQRTNAVDLKEGEDVLLIPTTIGQVMVVGTLDEEDYSAIETILESQFHRI